MNIREVNKMNNIKFFYNGIKGDGKLYTAVYDKLCFNDCIVLRAKTYEAFPEIDGVRIENDSDSMTDYFVRDSMYIKKDSKYYDEAHKAWAIYTYKFLTRVINCELKTQSSYGIDKSRLVESYREKQQDLIQFLPEKFRSKINE